MTTNLVDHKEIAEMLSIRPKSVYHIINTDESFPPPIVLSPRNRRWKREVIVKWIEDKHNQTQETSQ